MRKWIVTKTDGTAETLEADNFSTEDGTLILYDVIGGFDMCFNACRVGFAPGIWADIREGE